jgi:hypothetical protein
MQKHFFYGLLALGCCAFACVNGTNNAPQSGAVRPADSTATVSNPDAADLLRVLQGKWQNEQDPSHVLEILDEKMRHLNNGQLSVENMLEIDGKCLSAACKVDSVDTSEGWCFVEKGQFDAQCHLVVRCDKQQLQFRALGAANGTLAFKKM